MKLFKAAGAILLVLAPLSVSAQPPERPRANQDQRRPGDDRMRDDRMRDDRGGMNRPGPDRPGNGPGAGRPQPVGGGNGYGNWDNRWGSRPPAPPRHWTKNGDWYRHVRACNQRYRSYNPRTDMFTLRPGVTRRCML
jgi:hypothetical protein